MNDDENFYGFIYLWENTHPEVKEHKFYIGQHKGHPDDGYIGGGTIFQKVYWCKKFKGFWRRKIIEKCNDQKSLDEAEKRHIKEHNAVESNLYCNLALGGKEGNKNTPEIRKKISESRKGKPSWNKGLTNLPKHSTNTKIKRLKSKEKFYAPIFEQREQHIKLILEKQGYVKVMELAKEPGFNKGISANTIRKMVEKNLIKMYTFGYNDVRYIPIEKDFEQDIINFIKNNKNVKRDDIHQNIELSKGTTNNLLLKLQKENKIKNIRGYRENYFIINNL